MAEARFDADVVIAGAGPVGTWLAAELVAMGVSTLLLEARPERSPWSRGFMIQPRTLELFDCRGLSEPLLAAGRCVPSWHFAMGQTRLDFTGLPTRFPFAVIHPQIRTEELIERRLTRLGGSVWRDWRVTGLWQHPDRVEIDSETPSGPRRLTARYLVGCDGAHSVVRNAAEIAFTGTDSATVSVSGDVVLDNPPPPEAPIQSSAAGMLLTFPLPAGRYLVAVVDHATMRQTPPGPVAFEQLRAGVVRITGTDLGIRDPGRVNAVGDAAKQADHYRVGRVMLAGDAAHIHFPMGGQGMNLGIQDAHNLAWQLAAVLRDGASDRLLVEFEAERRPVGEPVDDDVRAQVALATATGLDGLTLRRRFDGFLRDYPALNRDLAGRLSALAVRYGPEGGDPRLGARFPDLDFAAEDEQSSVELGGAEQGGGNGGGERAVPVRAFETLRPGKFTLLDLTGGQLDLAGAVAAGGAEDLVHAVAARLSGGVDLPTDPQAADHGANATAGHVANQANYQDWAKATAVLIRPDGHVAWIGDDPHDAVATLRDLVY